MAIQLATKRIFLTCLIVSVAGSAVLGITAIIFPRSWYMQDELIVTAIFTGLFSLAALAASIPYERGHWPLVSGGGIGLIVISFGLTILAVWFPELERSETYIKFVGTISTVGGAASYVSLISLARVSKSFRWLRILTLGSGIFLATTIIGMIIVDPSYQASRPWERLIALSAVLAACGSIVVPIAHVLNKVQTAERVETVDVEMTIICPRCRLEQAVSSGSSTCQRCKLRFKIEIEEPRCEKCGYLLYRLTSNRCPECGEPFEQELVARDAGDEVSGT